LVGRSRISSIHDWLHDLEHSGTQEAP
ncbi:MAG: hypothetical protein K0Q73_8510, partial [Paenibacillus sp.]|nr:hypothetical protein [Paenibacillus sp.]